MEDRNDTDALISDLDWQIDQFGPRGIKNEAGNAYHPAYFKRGLDKAIAAGGDAVADYVRRYVHKPPSGGYKKLEQAESLDLACEALVADETKPYAHMFTDEDRAAARERLAPHEEAIAARRAQHRARVDAARARLRKEGIPSRADLDGQLRSRRY